MIKSYQASWPLGLLSWEKKSYYIVRTLKQPHGEAHMCETKAAWPTAILESPLKADPQALVRDSDDCSLG